MHTLILSPFTCYTNTLLSACVHAAQPLWIFHHHPRPRSFPATAFGVTLKSELKTRRTKRSEETPKVYWHLGWRQTRRKKKRQHRIQICYSISWSCFKRVSTVPFYCMYVFQLIKSDFLCLSGVNWGKWITSHGQWGKSKQLGNPIYICTYICM